MDNYSVILSYTSVSVIRGFSTFPIVRDVSMLSKSRPLPVPLEETSTHKSAKTHLAMFFWDLWP